MHEALSSSLMPILTFRQFLDMKCKTPPINKFESVKNCILESRKCHSSINKSVNFCHIPHNFHFCMKALVIAFHGPMAEGINCSLTKQQRV